MQNFTLHTPTKIIFGQDAELAVGDEVARLGYKKVFILYGGGSAKRSGLLGRIESSLAGAGLAFASLGGVEPNPTLSYVLEAADVCRRAGADFILGVGGGSAIDAAKAVGLALRESGDIWDIWLRRREARDCMPLGAVVTIAAAGTETSLNSVITHGGVKLGCRCDLLRPAFAIMNPALTATVPPYHTACGVVDILMHTIDRYFSKDSAELTARISEAVMTDTLHYGKVAMKDPQNYEARAELMWAGSLSHNGLTGAGRTVDMMCHALGHKLSALFGAAHGASLAAVWGAWGRAVYLRQVPVFARFAVNVMGCDMNYERPAETALAGIEALEDYFRAIGMPVTLPQLLGKQATVEEILHMASQFTPTPDAANGTFVPLRREDAAAIYRAANVDS